MMKDYLSDNLSFFLSFFSPDIHTFNPPTLLHNQQSLPQLSSTIQIKRKQPNKLNEDDKARTTEQKVLRPTTINISKDFLLSFFP